MLKRIGDLWDMYADDKWIVITTNIGWKKDGCNPMGAGIARQAASKYPDLPAWYGKKCKKHRDKIGVVTYDIGRLILFPTKPFNPDRPWASWMSDSSLELIEKSVEQLSVCIDELDDIDKVGIPLVGCQNGNLSRSDVLPILNRLDDRFVLVERYT